MTYTTSGAVLKKAGVNVNADLAVSGAWIQGYIDQAEALINNVARINFSGAYTGLRPEVSATLKEIASNLAAIYCIQYDMRGYTKAEAENMINILRDGALRGLSLIRDKKVTDFINGA